LRVQITRSLLHVVASNHGDVPTAGVQANRPHPATLNDSDRAECTTSEGAPLFEECGGQWGVVEQRGLLSHVVASRWQMRVVRVVTSMASTAHPNDVERLAVVVVMAFKAYTFTATP
jgi:hypothetical protein